MVVVVDITRISRSSKDLLGLVDEIKEKGASIKSLKGI
ncbi:recombinase family protein [Clostridium gasigenes]